MTRDPGLQPERTVLAWWRTALAVAVVAALTVRLAFIWSLAWTALTVLSVVGWTALVVLAYRRSTTIGRPSASADGWALPLSALITVGYALLGLFLLLSRMR